jgi:hypothetical protein
MSITNFIPEIWSAKLLESLKNALVFGGPNIINRDYEGEIANVGDTVHIVSIGRPAVADYVQNVTVVNPQQLTDADQTLKITRQKYFAFQIDDVDARQAKPGIMDMAMTEAAYALANIADQWIAGMYTGIPSGSTLTPVTGLSTTFSKAYETLVDLDVNLDQNNVPKQGRFAIVPPFFYGVLQKDVRFTSYLNSDSTDTLRNGVVGRAAGFDISESNNSPFLGGTSFAVIAGHKMAWTFAEQINKTVAYRPEHSFADAIKGLHIYGTKLVTPQALSMVSVSLT